MAPSPTKKLNIFLCFAYEDQDLCEKLRRHLIPLVHLYGFSICSDNQIQAGDNQAEERKRLINSADLVLLLISSDFIATDHCYEAMQYALELENKGRTNVISILLRSVNAPNAPFTRSKILPTNKIPLNRWEDLDAAYTNICTDINKIILELRTSWKPQRKLAQKNYVYYERREYKRDISICNRAIHFNPNDAAAYSKKGEALYELKRFRKAIPVLEKAIYLNPNDAAAHLNKGEALYELKRFEEAIPVLEKAMYLDSYNPISRLIKGKALYKLKRFEEAIPVLEEAIRLDPFLDIAYLIEGRALRKLKHFERAVPVLKEAVRLNPSNRAAIYSKRESTLWNYEASKSKYAVIIILGLLSLSGAIYGFYSLAYPKKPLISFIYNYVNFSSSKTSLKTSSKTPSKTSLKTSSKTPSKTSSKTQETSQSFKARYVIQQYYDAINKQNYRTAYSLWQDNVDGNGLLYDQFVSGYGNTIHDDITFGSIVPQDNNTVNVNITIHATERGGTGTYSAHYIVGAVRGSWKIISGSLGKTALRNTIYVG